MFGDIYKFKFSKLTKLTIMSISLALVSGVFAKDVQARTYFVSTRASQGSNSGENWSNAWRKLSDIDWNKIQPGDEIRIDGGSGGSYFYEGLQVKKSGTRTKPIRITTSMESGRNGQVTLIGYAGTSGNVGIDFGHFSHVRVEGHKLSPRYNEPRGSIRVYGFKQYGARVRPYSEYAKLRYIDFISCGTGISGGAGLRLGGKRTSCFRLSLRDSRVEIRPHSSGANPYLANCWFHGSDYISSYRDGVNILNTNTRGGVNSFTFHSCIFGPHLKRGVVLEQENSRLNLASCLFNNCGSANVVKTSSGNQNTKSISMVRCTSFLTPLNKNGQGHSSLSFTAGSGDAISSSIFYGGNVNISGSSLHSVANVQYKTSGNTVIISSAQQNPQFQNASSINFAGNNANWFQLKGLDFKVSSSSPFRYTGSTLTSVKQLSTR